MRRVNVETVTLIFLLLLVLITGFSMGPVIRDPRQKPIQTKI
jgi:hypothetical protein